MQDSGSSESSDIDADEIESEAKSCKNPSRPSSENKETKSFVCRTLKSKSNALASAESKEEVILPSG